MNPYSTHQALLVAAMAHTTGPILEIGGGWYSTPLISSFAMAQKRKAITLETGEYVYDILKRLETEWHEVRLMQGFPFEAAGRFRRHGKTVDHYIDTQRAALDQLRGDFSVVFVDQSPGFLRTPAIRYLADRAEFLITHDTEHVEHYHYEPLFSEFRYRWDFRLHHPNSAVLSNKRDCSVFAYLAPRSKEPREPAASLGASPI